MGKFSRLGNNLYTGKKSINFVGRRWLWYSISGVIVLVAILGLSIRGLNLGIEFTGGTQYTVTFDNGANTQKSADRLRQAVADTGIPNASSPVVSTSGANDILVQVESLTTQQGDTVINTIKSTVGVSDGQISPSQIGPSLGREVANRSLVGLIVFLVLVVLFIWAYFREWKASVAAIVALAHDVVITVGVYALSGFEVTPATVTGFLTILGFSLYDTVVVFDKVRENTKNLRQKRTTYAAAANLAVNQTLVRSINTSIVALLPVAALLYAGVVILGSGSLKDLALALFVGMAAGAYSSIFIATPLLAQLKSGEAEMVDAERRAKARMRNADRYASVPTFTEGMAVEDEPGAARGRSTVMLDKGRDEDDVLDEEDDPLAGSGRTPSRAAPRTTEPTGRGRVAPQARGPVEQSGSSRRQQPTRQPRSKRGRK